MTKKAQELILHKLKTTNWISNFYQKEISSIIKFIEQGIGSDGKEFIEKMQRTDAYRKQNFKDTHYDIAVAMGY
jgi:hypothetical protein